MQAYRASRDPKELGYGEHMLPVLLLTILSSVHSKVRFQPFVLSSGNVRECPRK